jgi:hypothetical protein
MLQHSVVAALDGLVVLLVEQVLVARKRARALIWGVGTAFPLLAPWSNRGEVALGPRPDASAGRRTGLAVAVARVALVAVGGRVLVQYGSVGRLDVALVGDADASGLEVMIASPT